MLRFDIVKNKLFKSDLHYFYAKIKKKIKECNTKFTLLKLLDPFLKG